MSKTARYALPLTVNPAGRRCFVVQVPDDPLHIAAFRGQILALASAYAWGNDLAHTALDVADVWQTIYDDINQVGCDDMIQARACEAGCGVQFSFDGGLTWGDCVDLSTCITDLANGAIADAIANGTILQGGVQPGPTTPPAPGECKTYHVILRASDRWLLPSSVSTNDSIEITNVVGGWSDGSLSWYCGNGDRYLASICDSSLQTHDPADPINPGAFHMQVVGLYGAGTYFSPLNSTFVFPAGVNGEQVWLQANDGSLEDNQGQIEFDVTVCTGLWCYHFDFSSSDHGFQPVINAGCTLASYGSGGWNSFYNCQNLHISEVRIYKDFANTPYHIVSVEYHYDSSGGVSTGLVATNSASFPWTTGLPAGSGQLFTVSPNLDGTTRFRADMAKGNSGGSTIKITGLTIHGSGACPFGTPNC